MKGTQVTSQNPLWGRCFRLDPNSIFIRETLGESGFKRPVYILFLISIRLRFLFCEKGSNKKLEMVVSSSSCHFLPKTMGQKIQTELQMILSRVSTVPSVALSLRSGGIFDVFFFRNPLHTQHVMASWSASCEGSLRKIYVRSGRV